MIAMDVVGVRVEMPSNQPIVLLKEATGNRFLPIWVGAVEATAIAFAQQGVQPLRPLTHDLMRDLLDQLSGTLTAVHITELREGVFYAQLAIHTSEAADLLISARPSDAIALALRTQSPIFASALLLDRAGIEVPEASNAETPEAANEEVARFREFLEQINPEDFLS